MTIFKRYYLTLTVAYCVVFGTCCKVGVYVCVCVCVFLLITVTHLRDLGLAALHRFGELLQLRSDLAEGDRGLEVPVTPLQIV